MKESISTRNRPVRCGTGVRAALGVFLSLACSLRADPPEEIRVDSLGARGVTFRDDAPWQLTEYFSRAGDVNGDGLADFILMRRNPEANWVREAVLVYGWSDDPLPAEPSMDEVLGRSTVFARGTDSIRGEAFDSIGDLDGDGFDDILILRPYGAPVGWEGAETPGLVHLVFGAPDLPRRISLDEPPDGVRMARFTSTKETTTSLCLSTASGSDMNGDGVNDFALGAGFSDSALETTQYPQGRVYVLYGGAPLEGTIDVEEIGRSLEGFILEGDVDGGALGRSAEFVGDADGDGLPDLLVGSTSLYGRDPSWAFLVLGSDDMPSFLTVGELLAEARGIRFVGAAPASDAGETLAAPGDLDGDGFADFVIGSPGAEGQKGAIYLVYGRSEFPREVALDDIADLGMGARFLGTFPRPPIPAPPGFSTESGRAGDALDVIHYGGDELPDFLIGSPRFELGGVSDVGRAYIVHGAAFEPGTYDLGGVETGELAGTFLSTESKAWFGSTMATVGDVNGDRIDDFLVSAPYRYQDEATPTVYLVYGNDGTQAPLALAGVSPRTAAVAGGTETTVTGSGFDETTEVFVGGRAADIVRVETTVRLVINVPPGAVPGPVDVEVHRGADVAALPGAMRYVVRVFPDVDLRDLPDTGRGVRIKGLHRIPRFADVDADGLFDVVVNLPNLGGVTVVYGRENPRTEIDLPEPVRGSDGIEGASLLWDAEETTPASPAPVGDVNGDGKTELAVVSPGTITVLFGGVRWPREAWIDDLVADGLGIRLLVADNGFGTPRIVSGGDIDGDGLGDILLRTRLDFFGEQGEVTIVRGRTEWPRELFVDDVPRLGSDVPEDRFGNALAVVEDLDADGRDELLIGAQGGFWRDDGNVYLVWGGLPLDSENVSDLVASGVATRFDSLKAKDGIGHDVCEIGDFNGDGITDFAFSAEGGGVEFAGESYVIFGGPSLELPTGENVVSMRNLGDGGVRIPGDVGYDYADAIEPAGDFDGDGLDDLLIASAGIRSRPSVYVLFGGATGVVELGELAGFGARFVGTELIGNDFGGGGDFNGDGLDDFVVGADRDGGPRTSSYVVFGTNGETLFIRGDVDRDGTIVITDPVALLGALFLGEGDLDCDDAGDANDDGKLDLADAVSILSHLYLGGSPPPAPFPEAGRDPTLDTLDCGS